MAQLQVVGAPWHTEGGKVIDFFGGLGMPKKLKHSRKAEHPSNIYNAMLFPPTDKMEFGGRCM